MIRNERGSILIAIGIALAMLFLCVGLLNWLNVSNQLIRYSRQKVQVENASRQLLSAIETCLMNLRGSGNKCPKQKEFVRLMYLPGDLSAASDPTPAPVTLNWSDITTTGGFLTAGQLTILNSGLSDANITVSRSLSTYYDPTTGKYKSADVLNGSTLVNIKIQSTPAGGFFAFNTSAVSKNYRATIQTPASFALYLRDGSVPKIDLQGSSKLSVYGKILAWESASFVPSDLIAVAQLPRLSLDQLYTTGTQIALTSLASADQTIFSTLRMIGVQTSWLPGAADPFAGAPGANWSQKLDYYYVYNGAGYPLPEIAGKTVGHGDTDPRDFVQARADVTVFPTALVFSTNNLELTCTRPANFNIGSIKTLILNRVGENLTLDYTVGPAAFACGQIAADTVTVKVPSGTTVAWYGNIIAKKIIVTGGGELAILNPFSYARIPGGLPVPAGLDSAEIMQLFMALDSSTGHNFFVPFTKDQTKLPADIQSRTLQASTDCTASPLPLCPCDTTSVKTCWRDTVQPPDLAAIYDVGPPCNGTGGSGVPPKCWSENTFFLTEEEN